MAITRRQFVTRLSTLAAAMGMSQVDLAQVTQAFAHGAAWNSGVWTDKPKVVWVHGAECTGCSTSLLSLFEDVRGTAVEGTSISTLKALDLAVGGDGDGGNVAGAVTAGALGITKETGAGHPYGHRTLFETNAIVGADFESAGGNGGSSAFVANIADVLIDFIDLQYHETVMNMGGDLAYQWLHQLMIAADGTTAPFVLVVEGAIQPSGGGGMWNKTGDAAWCSVGMPEQGAGENKFDEVVLALATKTECAAVVPIGQCATFGGYPACVSPVLKDDQTGAMGTYEYLRTQGAPGIAASAKVINVPGCPTNPWWFILTIVAWLVDFTQPSRPLGILTTGGEINGAAVDDQRRLKAVYGVPLHGPYCKRYSFWKAGVFASKPGEPGCLQLIGCKGPQTMTLCGLHGWNGQSPRNAAALDYGVSGMTKAASGVRVGGNCVAGGHPCMACTEQGYPDAFLPFVVR
jgi:hydrogenase small subunit